MIRWSRWVSCPRNLADPQDKITGTGDNIIVTGQHASAHLHSSGSPRANKVRELREPSVWRRGPRLSQTLVSELRKVVGTRDPRFAAPGHVACEKWALGQIEDLAQRDHLDATSITLRRAKRKAPRLSCALAKRRDCHVSWQE